MKASIFAGAVLALSIAAPVQGSEPKAGSDKSASSGSPIVCFAEAVTGSHLKKRVCMTEEDRERKAKESQEAMRRFKTSSSPGPRHAPPGGGPEK